MKDKLTTLSEEYECVFVIKHPELGFITHTYDGCGGPELEFTFKVYNKSGTERFNPLLSPEWYPNEKLANNNLKWLLKFKDEYPELNKCRVSKLYQNIYHEQFAKL